MPKVILYIATSQDGYIADKNGGVDWLPTPTDDESHGDFGYKAFYSSIDALVMGRTTYEQILTFGPTWPYPGKRSYVLTREQSQPNMPETDDSVDIEFNSLEPKELMAYLDRVGVKILWLVGGNKVVEDFYRNGLIDEYVITIIPKTLGDGIPLHKPILDKTGLIELECVEIGLGMKQIKLIKNNVK